MNYPKYIYHITAKSTWEQALANGFHTAPSLETEGFIHTSTEVQTLETANLHYKNQTDLVILKIDSEQLGDMLKYELAPKRGDEFPHIYGKLPVSAVVAVADFGRNEEGVFEEFPAFH